MTLSCEFSSALRWQFFGYFSAQLSGFPWALWLQPELSFEVRLTLMLRKLIDKKLGSRAGAK